ncbi:uncharacterized protein AKAW2_60339S [Aspergillus luchuensis]|uniref:Uncharacterized protein n=1 Tax=Aspergillus kawachii TaxID=1069201 RepID=A0A7R7WG27_ASPKA|nr:uncharacterized protein AKAW2_60339S [Aspergillus luchuensis]BCS02075.1 hypothetical protein AKAW2_60339S [Aspergillus luchuensis]BCS13760.1 hypothetical protein ALUC_60316S [Aspergillus luchuensis]GAA90342.1 hypothetical protein AKAW_08456 [Aspergillus luchuensis IFO 4308]
MSTVFQSRADFHQSLVNYNQTTTDGWDVIVSYSEEKLNALLKKYWSQRFDQAQISFQHKSGTSANYFVYTWNLTLDNPTLSFKSLATTHGDVAVSAISWKISGTMNTVLYSKGTETDLGDEDVGKDQETYLEVVTPVFAMDGESTDTSQAKASDSTFQFSDNTESSYNIILHFQSVQDSDWSVKTPDSSDPLNDSLTEMVNALNNNEEISSFTFTLGTVTNTKDQTSDFLQPQEFRFNATEGVLSIFIKVKGGSGKGTAETPQFQLTHEKGIAAIPEGYEASIILSQTLIRDDYLLKQIGEACKDQLQSSGGVTVDQAYPNPTLLLRFKSEKVWEGDSTSHGGWPVNGKGEITVDWDKYPLMLSIFDDGTPLTSHYKWVWDNALVELSYTTSNPIHGDPGGPYTATTTGSIKANSMPIATVSGDTLKFDIQFTSDNQPNASFSNVGPADMSGSVEFPTFNLELPDLNFFQTQNVLAPGEHFIKAEDTMCPCDLFVLGSMYS